MPYSAAYLNVLLNTVINPVAWLLMIIGVLVMKTRQGTLLWAVGAALLLSLGLVLGVARGGLLGWQMAFFALVILFLRFVGCAIDGLIAQAIIERFRKAQEPPRASDDV